MAAIATSSLTNYEQTIIGNKRIVFATYTPTTAAGSDTVNVGLTAITAGPVAQWTGTTVVDAACVVMAGSAGSSVVITNTTHANHPVSFWVVGR